MMREEARFERREDEPIPKRGWDGASELMVIAATSLLVGGGTGLVSVAFRLTLGSADALRDDLVALAREHGFAGLLATLLGCLAAATVAFWLVRRFSPCASGSGIPHVESVLQRELPPAPISLIPVKFFGGVLSIGSGLALGREGPSVQMGATIGELVGELFALDWKICRVLLAAGAGAGLAAAFNAPVAGAIFVLEELVREFELHIAIAALGASATAIAVSQSILGPAPEFHVEELAFAGPETMPLYLLFGALAGGAGVLYCRALTGAMSVARHIDRLGPGIFAAFAGALTGLLAWFEPTLVGGGDPLTQKALMGTHVLSSVAVIFLLRFLFGPLSYAAGTPGGIFAPMLVLGAELGLMYGRLCKYVFPGLFLQPTAFAVVGTAAFFTGVVRAPLTGIVLVTEMTSDATLLLPMLAASFAAMLLPTMLGEPPIYDSLRTQTPPRREEYAERPAPPWSSGGLRGDGGDETG
jgi:chloride channel protein, CIC family